MSYQYQTSRAVLQALVVWIGKVYFEPHHIYSWGNEIFYSLNQYKNVGGLRRRRFYWFFLEDESGIFKLFVSEKASYEFALLLQNPVNVLIEFDKWFTEKRELSMKKAELEMAKKNKKVFKPTSHSGIASLLQVLTKTMEKQGAEITSIAKVQYAVCVQAGVYIPDEFLLDVAIALDINDESEVV